MFQLMPNLSHKTTQISAQYHVYTTPSLIYLIYLSYEWVPKANLYLVRNLGSKQSSVGFEPWTPWLEGECANHWAKVWSHTSLSLVPHLTMW